MSSSSEVVVRVAFMQNGGNLAAAASAAAKEYKKIQEAIKLINDPNYVQVLKMQEAIAKKTGEIQIADAKQRLALLEKYGSVSAEQYSREQERSRIAMRERVVRNEAEAKWRTNPANRPAVFEESHTASQIARQNMEAQSRARREKEAYRGTPQGRQAIEEELRLRMQGRTEEADERRRQMREEMAYRQANPQAVEGERRARFEEQHTQTEARTQDAREETTFREANPDVGQREQATGMEDRLAALERERQQIAERVTYRAANPDVVSEGLRSESEARVAAEGEKNQATTQETDFRKANPEIGEKEQRGQSETLIADLDREIQRLKEALQFRQANPDVVHREMQGESDHRLTSEARDRQRLEESLRFRQANPGQVTAEQRSHHETQLTGLEDQKQKLIEGIRFRTDPANETELAKERSQIEEIEALQRQARAIKIQEELAYRRSPASQGAIRRETAENYQQGTQEAERQEQASGDQAAFMVDPKNRDAVMNRMRTEAQERRNQGAVGLAQSQYRLDFDSTSEGDGYARDEIARKAANRNVAMQAAAQASGRQADFAQSGKGQAAGLVQEKATRQDSMAKIRSEIALLQTRSKYVLDPKNRASLKEEIQLRQTLAAAMQRAKYTEQYGAAGGLMAAKDGAVAAGDAISGLFQKFSLMTAAGVGAVATLDAPWAMLTHHMSMFGMEVGMMVIPAVIDLCRWLQDGADWIQGWDDGTKGAISTTAGWAAAVVAASYAWKYLTPMLSGAFGILGMLDKGVLSVAAAAKALSFSYLGVTASSGPMNMALLSTIPKAKGAAAALSVTAAAAKSAAAAMWAFMLSNPVTAIVAVGGAIAGIAMAWNSVSGAAQAAAGSMQGNLDRIAQIQAALDRLRRPGVTPQEQTEAARLLPADLRLKLRGKSPAEQQQIIQEAAVQAQAQLPAVQQGLSQGGQGGLEAMLIEQSHPMPFNDLSDIEYNRRRNRLLANMQSMGLSQQEATSMAPGRNEILGGISEARREEIMKAVRELLQKKQGEMQLTVETAARPGANLNDLMGGNDNRPRRDLTIPSTGFQSKQMDVFAMRDQIQMNLVRDQAEQERFEKQMRALNQIVNNTAAAANATPAAPPAGGGGLD